MSETRGGILYIVSSFKSGGTETQLLEIMKGLDWERHRPYILCFQRKGGLLKQVEDLGVEIRTLGVDSIFSPGGLMALWRAAAWCRSRGIRVVHGFHFHGNLYAALLKLMSPGLQIIVCEQGLYGPSGPRADFGRWLYYRVADVVLVNCEAVRKILVDRDRLPASRISIIYGGVDTGRFSPAPPSGERREGPVVGCVGRLHPDKGQVVLARAAARVREAIPGVRILMAGDGPQRPELEAVIASEGVGETVTLLGDRRDVPRLLGEMDILVLPSMNEGFANAALEGNSSGLPVIVSDAGGNPEVIADGETGLVFPRGDHRALAQAIIRLCRDRDEARRMGEAGRARVLKEFGIDSLVRRHSHLYQGLITREGLKHLWDQAEPA